MSLSVIGAGYGRTGTFSLREALIELGLGPCHHMKDLIDDPSKVEPWARLARGEAVDWDQVFAGYNSACDWPSCDYYRELADHYPEAKVILTVRDAESWADSTQKTIFSDLNPVMHKDPSELGQVMRAVGSRRIADKRDRAGLTAAFEAHNAEVKQTVPAGRLLVYDVSQGWEPLCRFLGLAEPDVPFPLTNTTQSWRDGAAKRLAAMAQGSA